MMSIIVKGDLLAEGVKERMVREAALSLARNGLQRTSFSEVLEAAGAPRGSLYHHFPGGKEELVLAALDAAGAFLVKALDASPDCSALGVARAFLGVWRAVLAQSDFAAGCAVAAVTVAADSALERDRAAAKFAMWRTELASRLIAGGVDGARAPGLARLLIAGAEGAVLLARAERSLAPFDETAVELLAVVETSVSR